jgi:hypothetical protein
MKKEELIRLTSLSLIFVFTYLVAKDVLSLPKIVGGGVAGLIAGMVSAVWYRFVIKGKSDRFITILTIVGSAILLTIAYLYSHR